MILGRNAALWVGLVAAVLNVLVLVVGVNFTPDQILALNAAAGVIIGLIANKADPTTTPTFAATTKGPDSTTTTP